MAAREDGLCTACIFDKHRSARAEGKLIMQPFSLVGAFHFFGLFLYSLQRA
jgi:hypothetical protein